jgi:hypothetical protein
MYLITFSNFNWITYIPVYDQSKIHERPTGWYRVLHSYRIIDYLTMYVTVLRRYFIE